MIELFYKVREKFIKFFYKIVRKGNRRITIVIVPHSGKKMINLFISNFIIWIFSIVISFLLIFSIISIGEKTKDENKIRILSKNVKVRKSNTLILKRKLDELYLSLKKFEINIKKLNRKLGIDNLIVFSTILSKIKKANLKEDINKVITLNNMIIQNTEYVQRTLTMIANFSNMLKDIPLIWPVVGGGYITSRFGWRRDPFTNLWVKHTGIDIAWWIGTPIRATADGIIKYNYWLGGYGWCVIIKHKYGFSSLYGHLLWRGRKFKVGRRVKKGQIIGYLGSTGRSTGYHLHYEVIIGVKAINPVNFIINGFSGFIKDKERKKLNEQ